MEITKEAFNDKFQETLDDLLIAMAGQEEISPDKFFSMACILENLAFFSPVIYSVLQEAKKPGAAPDAAPINSISQ
jgi:hypothetical protein